MASDLPETHAGPQAMARCLASYLACPDEIFRRVCAEFGTSPCLETIRDMRALHLKPPTPVEPWKPHDGYYPADASASMAKRNALFVAALLHERALSRWRATPDEAKDAALNSPLLSNPALVDKRWEKAIVG